MRLSYKVRLLLAGALLAGAPMASGASSRGALWMDVSDESKKLRDLEDKLLAPDPADAVTFAAFLEQPDTGLVRLLPREKGEKILSLRGGGAYCSFSKRTQEYGHGSDIELSNGSLSTGFAGADFGFFEDAGDVPLETVTRSHPTAAKLASLAVPTAIEGAREMQAASGFRSSARPDQLPRRVKASAGQTYALRSVIYGCCDVLVAFRVVRQDEDGSVTLLWKLLERFPTPELKRTPEPKN